MLKLVKQLLIIVILIGVMQPGTVNAGVEDFVINTFEADYYLSKDNSNVATMTVTESITATFPEINQNHGLLRSIPQTYRGQNIDLKVITVVNENGAPYFYTTYESNDQLVLKIGDANTYVHGQTIYNVTYTLRNVISFYNNNDEFYWDVNGNEWQQPFGEVIARIHTPQNISNNMLGDRLCYTGVFGSSERNCKLSSSIENNGSTLTTVTAKALSPGETLSLVLAFEPNTFSPDTWPKTRLVLQLISGVSILLFSIFVLVRQWNKHGKDEPGQGTVIPQYTPPDKLDVLSSYAVLNENVKAVALTATVIELAIMGYIDINDIAKKDSEKPEYELKLIKSGSGLTANYRTVIEAFFGTVDSAGTEVKLKDKANHLSQTVLQLKRTLLKTLTHDKFFRSNPNFAKDKYSLVGFGMIFIATIVGWAVPDFLMLIPASGLGLGGLLFMILSSSMPARTSKGSQLREYLLGVQDYIKLAEQDRIRFHQTPKGARDLGANINDPKVKIKLFESLLPYAMIFGLEKEWAKQFKDVYADEPDWYGSKYNRFNYALFGSSLSAFSSQTNKAFTASSSSGSSGFSGGGFSGGGGGGGGGGGW